MLIPGSRFHFAFLLAAVSILFYSLFFSGCTSSGMYPANIRIEGLPAAIVTGEIIDCYQSEDTMYILFNDGHREKLVSVYPWDPEIRVPQANRFEATTYGWDNGHSTILSLFYQTKHRRKKVLTIGKNVRVNTPVMGDVLIQIGPPAGNSSSDWLHAKLVGGKSGIARTVEAGLPAKLEIEGESWDFVLFGASLPQNTEDERLHPSVYFSASFVLYLPGFSE